MMIFYSLFIVFVMEKREIRLQNAVKNKEYKEKSFSRLAFSRL